MTITFYEFMIETYSEFDISVLCDDDDFKKVKEELSESMPVGEKIRRLISFCKRHSLSKTLWDKVKEQRKKPWADYQMPENPPDSASAMGQVRENFNEVNGVFREIKAIETMDAHIEDTDVSHDNTHPLTKSDAELKKWFSDVLNIDEQIFLLTSALFSGLEKHEFLKLYDGINQGLQVRDSQSEEGEQ